MWWHSNGSRGEVLDADVKQSLRTYFMIKTALSLLLGCWVAFVLGAMIKVDLWFVFTVIAVRAAGEIRTELQGRSFLLRVPVYANPHASCRNLLPPLSPLLSVETLARRCC